MIFPSSTNYCTVLLPSSGGRLLFRSRLAPSFVSSLPFEVKFFGTFVLSVVTLGDVACKPFEPFKAFKTSVPGFISFNFFTWCAMAWRICVITSSAISHASVSVNQLIVYFLTTATSLPVILGGNKKFLRHVFLLPQRTLAVKMNHRTIQLLLSPWPKRREPRNHCISIQNRYNKFYWRWGWKILLYPQLMHIWHSQPTDILLNMS